MAVLLLTVFLSVLLSSSEAAYRKPPFNGSIFGKRTGTNGKLNSTKKLDLPNI